MLRRWHVARGALALLRAPGHAPPTPPPEPGSQSSCGWYIGRWHFMAVILMLEFTTTELRHGEKTEQMMETFENS